MFVKTMKLKKGAALAAVAVITAAVVLIIGLVIVRFCGVKKSYRVKTEQQRQSVVSELGWEISPKPSEHKTVVIPKEFDKVYKGYNELQKEQGFDLEKYKGKEVVIYTYPVYNYKGHKDCMQLTLMAYDGVLIGGDICCTELDGFMQGLINTQKK